MDRYTIIVVALCAVALVAYFVVVPHVLKPQSAPPGEATATPAPPAISAATPGAVTSPQPSPPPPAEPTPATVAAQSTPVAPPVAPPVVAPPTPEPSPTVGPTIPVKDEITVVTNRFRAVFTNRGAALRSLTLLDYYTTAKVKDKSRKAPPEQPLPGDLELLREVVDGQHSLVLFDDLHDLDSRVYNVEGPTVGDDGVQRLTFTLPPAADGLIVTKVFTLRPDSRAIGVTIKLRHAGGAGQAPLGVNYRLRSAAGIAPEQLACSQPGDPAAARAGARDTHALVATRPGHLLYFVPPKGGGGGCFCYGGPKGSKTYSRYTQQHVTWAGVDNKYFAALLAPSGGRAEGAEPSNLSDFNMTCDLLYRNKPVALEPGQEIAEDYLFYVGPKVRKELGKFPDARLALLLELKGFDPIGRVGAVLGWFLHLFHVVIPNYGVAIILLTVLVRAALHPLTKSSQTSMYKMQKVQPKVKELRERLKNDKQRMNEEMMKLYRESGVNPMGGCLPMLLQFPILIGLFKLLRQTVELRQEPFCLWMDDLSKPDTAMCLPFTLPIIGSSLNILPILMIGAMVAQQRLTPKSQDPQQQQTQKMMAFMPIFFGVLFYNMASGLVLYWFVSTCLGALEQWYIKKRLEAADAAGGLAPKKSGVKLRRFKP